MVNLVKEEPGAAESHETPMHHEMAISDEWYIFQCATMHV
jgi:hypothetical protein